MLDTVLSFRSQHRAVRVRVELEGAGRCNPLALEENRKLCSVASFVFAHPGDTTITSTYLGEETTRAHSESSPGSYYHACDFGCGWGLTGTLAQLAQLSVLVLIMHAVFAMRTA